MFFSIYLLVYFGLTFSLFNTGWETIVFFFIGFSPCFLRKKKKKDFSIKLSLFLYRALNIRVVRNLRMGENQEEQCV